MVEITDEPGWYVEAREDLYAEKLESFEEDCQNKYSPKKGEKYNEIKEMIKIIEDRKRK